MKKKELLNEIMGVPKALTPWVNSISQIIYDDASALDEWDESGPVTYVDDEGEVVEDEAFRMEERFISGKKIMDLLVNINGFNSLKEFTNSEMFQKFPLWRPEVSYRLIGIPKVLYDKEGDATINARVGSQAEKLSQVGKLKVLPSVEMHFDIMTDRDNPTNNLKQDLNDTVAHELLHMYQKLKQLETGGESHFGKEGVLNAIIMNPVLEDVQLNWWKKFLNLIYLHLSFEVNARVTQLYYLLKKKNINTKEDFLKELHKSSVWEQMKHLEDFNAEEYVKTIKIPGLGDNPFEMLNALMNKAELASKGINTRNKEEMLKSLIELWDISLIIGNKGLKQMGMDVNMEKVPQSVKKNPIKFFKFFEKRFHKKAENWKRKLYRIGTLLLQDKEEALQKNK
tara:strand:- start:806 stop:1996 length:1191 start_codon:yes stop_codon:yes gene_type:complete